MFRHCMHLCLWACPPCWCVPFLDRCHARYLELLLEQALPDSVKLLTPKGIQHCAVPNWSVVDRIHFLALALNPFVFFSFSSRFCLQTQVSEAASCPFCATLTSCQCEWLCMAMGVVHKQHNPAMCGVLNTLAVCRANIVPGTTPCWRRWSFWTSANPAPSESRPPRCTTPSPMLPSLCTYSLR